MLVGAGEECNGFSMLLALSVAKSGLGGSFGRLLLVGEAASVGEDTGVVGIDGG